MNDYLKLYQLQLEKNIAEITPRTLFTSSEYKHFSQIQVEATVATATDYVKALGAKISQHDIALRAATPVIMDWTKNEITAYTDGRTIHINANSDLVGVSNELEIQHAVIQGMLRHEIGHVLFTDSVLVGQWATELQNGVMMFQPEKLSRTDKKVLDKIRNDKAFAAMWAQLAKNIENCIEDGYIESELDTVSGGKGDTVRYLCTVNSMMITSGMQNHMLDFDAYSSVLDAIINYVLLYAKYGMTIKAPAKIEKLFKALAGVIDKAVTSRQPKKRLELINQVTLMIYPYIADALNCASQQNNGTNNQPGQNGQSGNGTSSAPNQSSQSGGNNQANQNGQGDSSSSEGQSHQSDGSNGQNAQSDKSNAGLKGNANQNGSSDSSGQDKKSNQKDGKNESGNAGNKSDAVDGKDKKDGNANNSGSETAGNNSNDGKKVQPMTIDDILRLLEKIFGSQKVSKEAPIRTAGSIFDYAKKEVPSNNGGNTVRRQNNAKTDTGEDGGSGGDTITPDDVKSIIKEMAAAAAAVKVEQQRQADLSKMFHDIAKSKQTSAPVLAGRIKGMTLVRVNKVPDSAELVYQSTRDTVEPVAKSIAKEINRVIKEKKQGYRLSGLTRGNRIQANLLHHHDGKIFVRSKLPNDIAQMCVGVLVDESSSTNSSYASSASSEDISIITYERILAMTVAKMCQDIEIPAIIYGYQGNSIKSYVEPETVTQQDILRLAAMTPTGGTPTAPAFAYMLERMKERPEEVKLLFIVTDGRSDNKAPLPLLLREAKQAKIMVIAAGIGSCRESIKQEFPGNFLDISDMSQMPRNICNIIKRMLID